MSNYLARLKAANSQKALPDALPKLPEGASGSKGSSLSSPFFADSSATAPTDKDTERRRAKVLAMLEANPTSRIAVVAEAGDPVTVGIAIRGIAYGEMEIPAASYEPFALLAMLERYNASGPITVH